MLHALHGNFGTPADWEPSLPPELPAKCWNLWQIRRDFPEARTLSGFAHWLNQQAATASASHTASNPAPSPPAPIILAGYSLGGRLALATLAAAPPGLWQAAILLAPHPGLSGSVERAARLTHDQTWAERCRHQPWPKLLADWNAQPVLAGDHPPSAPESWRAEIASAFENWSLGHQPDYLPFLRQIRIPILWITGSQDLKFTALAAQADASFSSAETASSPGLPRLTHHILPHCGHRLLQQSPQKIRSLVREFLA